MAPSRPSPGAAGWSKMDHRVEEFAAIGELALVRLPTSPRAGEWKSRDAVFDAVSPTGHCHLSPCFHQELAREAAENRDRGPLARFQFGAVRSPTVAGFSNRKTSGSKPTVTRSRSMTHASANRPLFSASFVANSISTGFANKSRGTTHFALSLLERGGQARDPDLQADNGAGTGSPTRPTSSANLGTGWSMRPPRSSVLSKSDAHGLNEAPAFH